MRLSAALCLVSALYACRAQPPPSSAPPPPRAGAEPAAPSAGPAPAPSVSPELPAPSAPRLSLEEVARTDASPSPVVEILFPFSGSVVTAAKARASRVRLRVDAWPLAPEGGGVAVALDDERPRFLRALPTELALGVLLPEDRLLANGLHRLVAVAVDASGLAVRSSSRASRGPWAAVHFFVEARGELPADAPFLVLLQPGGTYYRDDGAASFLLDVLAVGLPEGDGPPHLELAISGGGSAFTTHLDDAEPRRVRGLAVGDHQVEVTLRGSAGGATRARARVTRLITVNPALTDSTSQAAAGGGR